jgi:diguanylate cyclase (GGDEF)-like protein
MTTIVKSIGVVFALTGLSLWTWFLPRKTEGDRWLRLKNKNPNPPGPPEDSLKDPVTGLYNRKHLLQRLQEEMARRDRTNEKMAVILWDIDGFIDFNNAFGQNEGDRLLKKVGETVRRSLRVYDEAFRSGADEFCAILLPAEGGSAQEVTRRVRHVVEKELFKNDPEYNDCSFSISSGIAFYPSEQKLPEALLHEAGQALYQSRLTRL